MPVPNICTGVIAGVRKPLTSLCVPSGRSTERSYDTAPGTMFQLHVGIASPCVGLVAAPAGACSVFWNVPMFDHGD